jgi:integral membrane protein
LNKYFNSQTGLFRVATLLEGVSLIVLMFIAVPIKYLGGDESWVKLIGPIHGLFFVGFCYMAYAFGKKHGWNWRKMAPLLLFASFIPFGTFYFDHKVLKPIHQQEMAK